MRNLFARKFNGKVWDLDAILELFRCELEEKGQASCTVKAEKSREYYTTGALYQASSYNRIVGSTNNNKYFLLGQGNNSLFRCTKFADPKDIFFKNRLCFMCLYKSNIASKFIANCS